MPKLLIIDDEKDLMECLTNLLKANGYDVTLVTTGREAIDICLKQPPDLAFLDLGLPDMDGRQVLKEIKSKAPKLKIAIVTGNSDRQTQDELLSQGADYFLPKPLALVKLLEFLSEVLGKK